ncbi:MAG: hypothetical protein AB7F35_15650 [Acetobacteraceae bacterium]
MYKLAVPAALAVSLMLPVQAAHAQTLPITPSPTASEQMMVIRPSHLLAVGAGVIGGVIVGEMLFATDLGLVVGGVLGGYLTNLWYNGRQLELHLGATPKS